MLNLDKHRTAMFRLLTDILRDATLSAVLGFKGGTACYFFYNLPRFSIDLDFDIVERKENPKICDEIFKSIKKIIVEQGLEIRDEKLKKDTVFFLVSYEKGTQGIKIEISHRDYPNKYEIKDFYGLSVKTMVQSDIFAHKLVAATDRKKIASRDFFDLYYFFKESWPINEGIIKVRTGGGLREYLQQLAEFIQARLFEKNILHGMGELIDESLKTWVKNNLKKELIRFIKFHLDQRL